MPVFVYHEDCREGKCLPGKRHDEEYEQHLKDGWVNTPAKLSKLKPKPMKKSDAEILRPEELIERVKRMGYKVLNDVDLDCLKVELQEEVKIENDKSRLMALYSLDSEKLSEKELIELGKVLGLKLKRTMRMDTMRDKINKEIKG